MVGAPTGKATLSVWLYHAQTQSEFNGHVLQSGELNTVNSSFIVFLEKIIGQVKWQPTLQVTDAAGLIVASANLSVDSDNNFQNGWHHVLISIDGPNQTGRVYVNDGVYWTTTVGFPNGATSDLGLDTDEWTVCDRNINTGFSQNRGMSGGIACLWLAAGEYLDLTVTANRRKFINADLTPVDLGLDGSATTGIVPHIWLRNDAPNSWGINYGQGGAIANFSPNITFSRFTTSNPSACEAAGVVFHSAQRGFDIHEPKGVDTAAEFSIFVADGAGGGNWQEHPLLDTEASTTPPTPVTLTAPTAYTAITLAQDAAPAREVGVAVTTGPTVEYVNTARGHIVDAEYEVVLSHDDVSAQTIFLTWRKSGVLQQQYTQQIEAAQNDIHVFKGQALFALEDGDTLDLVAKVAAGDLTIENARITLHALPSQE